MGRRLRIGQTGVVRVTKTAPGRWVASARTRTLANVTVRVSASAGTRHEAHEAVRHRAWEKAFSGTPGVIHGEMTLLELVMRTLAGMRSGQVGRGNQIQTVNMYERHVKFLRGETGDPAIGDLPLTDCSMTVVQTWLEGVSERAPTSARHLKVLLNHAFDLALRHGVELWRENPAARARLRVRPRVEPDLLSPEEMAGFWRRVLEWEKGKRTDLSGIVATLMATGCRPGESLALLWSEIDLDSAPPVLTISGTVVRQDGELLRQPFTKTQAGFRTLILPEWYAAMLRERRPGAVNDLVFPNARGGLLDPHNIGTRFREARGQEYAHIKPKSFRSTVGTLIAQAAGAEAAAQQLGHVSPAITARHYIRNPHRGGDHRALLGGPGPVT